MKKSGTPLSTQVTPQVSILKWIIIALLFLGLLLIILPRIGKPVVERSEKMEFKKRQDVGVPSQ
ncbi:MAG: hypothetical protein KA974_00960 [Saprospiraceae bacterium]|nr:hypothetical protein [Saprospiraceae bacterium]MBP7679501.1 hypothetical protein [Saprospiraceae bacterium]